MPPVDPDPNEEEKLEKLDQDYTKPFSLPDDVTSDVTDDNQLADTNVDAHELYDEGLEGATEADLDDQRKNSITGYTPPKKKET